MHIDEVLANRCPYLDAHRLDRQLGDVTDPNCACVVLSSFNYFRFTEASPDVLQYELATGHVIFQCDCIASLHIISSDFASNYTGWRGKSSIFH